MLTLAMVFSLLPNVGMITAQAAAQTTAIDLTVASPPTSGTNWTYDSATNTLYLNGVNIDGGTSPAVKVPDGTIIETIGLNTLKSTAPYDGNNLAASGTLGCAGALTLQGSGILDISNGHETGRGIYSVGNLTITSGYIKAYKTANGAMSIQAKGDLQVDGGHIDTSTPGAADSDLYATVGILVNGNATINGGYIKAVGYQQSGAQTMGLSTAPLTINGGYLEAEGKQSTTNTSSGITCTTFINNGGVVKATSGGCTSTSTSNKDSFGILATTSASFNGGVTIGKSGTLGNVSNKTAAVYSGKASAAGSISLSNSETGKKSDATTALFDNGASGNYKFFVDSSGGTTPATDVVIAKAFSNTTYNATNQPTWNKVLDGHYIKVTSGSAAILPGTDTAGITVNGGSYVESSDNSAIRAFPVTVNATLVGVSAVNNGIMGDLTVGATGTAVGIASNKNSAADAFNGISVPTSSKLTANGNIIGIATGGTGAGVVVTTTDGNAISAGNIIGVSVGGEGAPVSASQVSGTANITGYSTSTRGINFSNSTTTAISGGSITAVGNSTSSSALFGATLNINGGKVWAYNQGSGGSISATTLVIGAGLGVKTTTTANYGDALTDTTVSGNSIADGIAFIQASGPSVTVGNQTGKITAGTAGSATFAVTPSNYTINPTTYTTAWTGTAPTGVTLSYTNGNITANATAAAVAGTYTFTVTGTSGSQTATSAVVTLTVSVPVTLQSIAITTPPTITTYTYGESFDKTGMVVTATYSDGTNTTTAPVTSYTHSPNGALTMSDTTITISYTEGAVTRTATQSITMQKATATEAMKTVTGTVSKDGATNATITLPTKPAGATYGTPTAGGTITMTGMSLNGDVLTYTAPASTAGDTGTITISVTNATNYNDYSITVTITSTNKIPVTITGLTDPNKTYDGSAITDGAFGTPSFSPSWSGTLTYTYYEGNVTTGAALSIAPKNIGDYTLVAAIPDSDAGHAGSATVPFTIAKKDITITADDKSMIKGGTPPTYTVTYAGFVGTDSKDNALTTEAVATCSADGQTAGTFPITFSTQAVLNGTVGANYTITAHNNGTLTVNESTHTVTFDSQGGSAVNPLTNVTNGTTISAPAAPTKANNTFGGWYKEPACTTAWNFASDTVTADIILYAKWTQVLTYTISASAGSGGTISPSGSVSVASGASQTFTISPYSNYSISSVVVDGVNQGAISSYTLNNVTANHTITASFTYHGGGGGGGGGGSSDSTPTTPTTPTPTIPPIGNVTDSKQEVKQDVKINIVVSSKDGSKTDSPVVSVTVKDTAVSVVIPQSVVTDAIKTAIDLSKSSGEKTTVKFDLTASDSFKTMNAELPKAAMTELVKNVDNLVIQTQLGAINLDKKAMTTVANAATTSVTISTVAVDKTALPKETQSLVGDKPVYDFTITSGNKTISNFGNGRAVITLPYMLTKGEKANNIVIYYINDKGNLEVVKSCNYDEKTKTVSFATTHFSKYTVGVKTASYLDVPKDWYTNAVEYVTIRGLFSGYNGNFTPNGTMTRAMFVQVLANLESISPTTGIVSRHADVDGNAWYATAVMWATNNKLVGNKDGLFKPDEAISREEMAVILYNYIKYKGIDLNVVNDKPFADINDVSTEAKTAVEFMKKYGLIEGVGNNTYAPKRTATRAEVAAIFTNVIKVLAK